MSDSIAVLLVGCDDVLTSVVKQIVMDAQHLNLERVGTAEAAIRRLQEGKVGLVLPFHSGPKSEKDLRKVLAEACTRRVPTVILSNDDDPQSRLRFLNWGAVDCLPSPLDVRRLALMVDLLRVREQPARTNPVPFPSAAPSRAHSAHDFLASSPAMSGLVSQFRRVAPLDTTVLLLGETGCGKTHAARVIHDQSSRSSKPFVVVECGALTPTLLASELFGHTRGSFTGADRDYAGKLASAEDGTVFLDEIDTMPLECQAKLLRTVEDRIYQAVGSSKTQTLQARLIVATNRPLEDEVAAGRFRSDLYYRLNVVAFSLPPLRDRRADIQPLAERFLATFSQRAERPIRGFTPAALEALQCHDWPGNIRELRNVVERSVALCATPMIDHSDLPDAIQQAYDESAGCRERVPVSGGFAAANELAAARMGGELQRLLAALGRHNHNRVNTAAELGISRVTLYKKLRQHRLA